MATAPTIAEASEDTTMATTPTRKNKEKEGTVVLCDDIKVTQQKVKDYLVVENQTIQANGEHKEHQLSQKQMSRGSSLAAPIPPPPVQVVPGQPASTLTTNAAKKIRRAFSMPRNPFRWSRKFKTAIATNAAGSDMSVGRSNNTTSCVGGGRGHSGSIVSLSSSYDAFVCKDSNCNALHPAATAVTATISAMTAEESSNAAPTNHNKRNTAPVRTCSEGNDTGERKTGNHARVLRRSSFRKFLHRIAQHLSSSVSIHNVGTKKQSTISATAAAAATATASASALAAATSKTAAAVATQAAAGTADRVPSIGVYQWPTDHTPGVMGLKNHGNTCFMNAVLQCLSHTDILAEYFVLDQYKVDLKRRNKINSRKFGTKGELTEQLANVLKALWTCKNESDHSTGFKAVVDRYGSQFHSSTQHDAQEFLFWLLDKVHEDLNTATKRRYKNVKNSYGRPDEVIAAETLANHIRCNNSFVQAVFQAQFRSSLTCPRCQKQSNTFDPFHCISVQLPQLAQQMVFVTVVYKKHKPQQVKYGVTVPAGSPIVALREQLHADTGIPIDCMVLVDLNKEGFTRVFYDTQPIETLKGIKTVYCIEVPEMRQSPIGEIVCGKSTTLVNATTAKKMTATAVAETTLSIPNKTSPATAERGGVTSAAAAEVIPQATKLKASSELALQRNGEADTSECCNVLATTTHATDLLLIVANVQKKQKKRVTPVQDPAVDADDAAGAGDQLKEDGHGQVEYVYEPFGAPFSMKAPRDCSYMELQKIMLREMAPLLKPEVFSYATPLKNMFRIRLQDPSADPDTYLEQVEHPLLTEVIDMALLVLSSEAGPPHVKLLLEWTTPEEYFVNVSSTNEAIVEHKSVAHLNARKSNDTAALTLEQCLEHYTKAETLSAEDAWRCPHCQQYLPVVKTLGLWSLPDILVVHFKRFRQHQEKGPQAAKLTTMVKFPLNAFDMSPHLARGMNGEMSATSLDTSSNGGTNYRPSPWRKMRISNDSRSSTLNSRAEQKDTRYDLYAVCYHQGDTLETGHYTAACKNPYDRQWYKFDDQRVSKVPEDAIQEEIINNEAYMLFYQRRAVDTAECSGSSSNSGDHWISRIAPPTVPNIIVKEKPLEKAEVPKSSHQAPEETTQTAQTDRKSKPEEKPKIFKEIEEDDMPCAPDIETSNQANISNSATANCELLNIEELDYADADADADATAENLNANDPKKTNVTAMCLEAAKDNFVSSNPDTNDIFLMDEECIVHEPPTVLKATTENQSIESSTDATPSLVAMDSEIFSPITSFAVNENSNVATADGEMAPHDIKSHSASNTTSGSSSSSTTSLSSGSSPHSLAVSVYPASSLQSKLNGYASNITNVNCNGSHKEVQLSSSLKSQSGSMSGPPSEFSRQHLHNQQHYYRSHNQHNNWQGSRSSVSAVENTTQQTQRQATSLKLRHSFSTSSNYKLRECSETLSSLLRNSTNTCSKDTLLFIDQQSHHHGSLIEDESDSYMGRSLWISPVTPHKLITVSPKN